MNTSWADWVVVGLAVAGAAIWLVLHMRHHLRRKKNRPGPCGAPCEGCPFAKTCGEKQE